MIFYRFILFTLKTGCKSNLDKVPKKAKDLRRSLITDTAAIDQLNNTDAFVNSIIYNEMMQHLEFLEKKQLEDSKIKRLVDKDRKDRLSRKKKLFADYKQHKLDQSKVNNAQDKNQKNNYLSAQADNVHTIRFGSQR